MPQNQGEDGSNAPQTPKRSTQPQTSSTSSSGTESGVPRTPGSGRRSNRRQKRFALGLASLYDEELSTVVESQPPSLRQRYRPNSQGDSENTTSGRGKTGVSGPSDTYGLSATQPSEGPSSSSVVQTSDKDAQTSSKSDENASIDIQRSDNIAVETIISEHSSQVNTASRNASKEGIKILDTDIRSEWIGTSQFYIEHAVFAQMTGDLDKLIDYRKSIVRGLSLTPYDPSLYIDLSQLDNKLGFTDIGVGNAHKALILIESALGIDIDPPVPKLQDQVRSLVSFNRRISSQVILENELANLRRLAYIELLDGLLGCAAFWDGLKVAKNALELFPEDGELLELRGRLKEGFKERHNGLKEEGTKMEDLVVASRTGKIYQKKYPWIDPRLYTRTPALIRKINDSLANKSCKVRPVVFGSPTEVSKSVEDIPENQDVGPLGLFATRDIEDGETILVDKTLLGISDVPFSRLYNCECCHACLLPPYRTPSEIVNPSCCKTTAYCTQYCHDKAMKSYHSVLCGQDMDWLYEEEGANSNQALGPRWCPILFLRLIAVVLGDMRKSSPNADSHPLEHHLIARMTAHYESPQKLRPDLPHDWQFLENVIMPTRILLGLGIDIFKNRNWDPEVVQTIFWRIDNNANMGVTNLFPRSSSQSASQHIPLRASKHQKSQSLPTAPSSSHWFEKFVARGGIVKTSNVNPLYLFFNHSCLPNVTWHVAVPHPEVGISWLIDENGSMMLPGNSAVSCVARRNIACGEELKISYVGEPLGAEDADKDVGTSKGVVGGITWEELTDENWEGSRETKRAWLRKWFENGCGCEVCETENEVERQKERELEREQNAKLETGIKLEADNIICESEVNARSAS